MAQAPLEPLRPVDVAVALALSGHHRDRYAVLSKRLGLSPSVVHGSIDRLRGAGLLLPGSREPNRTALLAFLEHGVRYVFPGVLAAVARGIPTAHVGPDLAEPISGEPVVWPSPAGSATGPSIAPLHPRQERLPESAPGVDASLALVDALRVGRARERALAREVLARRFEAERAGAARGYRAPATRRRGGDARAAAPESTDATVDSALVRSAHSHPPEISQQ